MTTVHWLFTDIGTVKVVDGSHLTFPKEDDVGQSVAANCHQPSLMQDSASAGSAKARYALIPAKRCTTSLKRQLTMETIRGKISDFSGAMTSLNPVFRAGD